MVTLSKKEHLQTRETPRKIYKKKVFIDSNTPKIWRTLLNKYTLTEICTNLCTDRTTFKKKLFYYPLNLTLNQMCVIATMLDYTFDDTVSLAMSHKYVTGVVLKEIPWSEQSPTHHK